MEKEEKTQSTISAVEGEAHLGEQWVTELERQTGPDCEMF